MLTFLSDDPVDIKPYFGEGCEVNEDEDDGMFTSLGPEGAYNIFVSLVLSSLLSTHYPVMRSCRISHGLVLSAEHVGRF